MRRVLFVSRHYASDFSIKVGGIFQRMRMLLDAATLAADAIDILFIVDPEIIARFGPAISQDSLKEAWGIEATVHLAPRVTRHRGRILQTASAIVDFRAQDDYFRLNGPVQFEAVRTCVAHDTDLVIAHRLFTGSTVAAAQLADVPIVMDLDDIEHRNRARQLDRLEISGSKAIARLELRALRRGELATLRACSTSFVCSTADREYLVAAGVTNTTVVPNAMRFDDAPLPACAPADPPTLFFIGTYGYRPNADAAEYLIQSVLPLVRARLPEVRLTIVGEDIEKIPSHASRPVGVDFRGFVPDLRDAYGAATVVCCPIRAGGGTRIKLIEAAAASKPIVSTTIGAEGLEFTDGVEILLRDTPRAFADACVALIEDPSRAAAMGLAAYAKARALYDRKTVVERIAAAFRSHAKAAS